MTAKRGPVETFHDPSELRRLRILAGLSQTELAEKVGVSSAHMCNLEHGKVGASAPLLSRLAAALNCQISDFERKPEPEARSA